MFKQSFDAKSPTQFANLFPAYKKICNEIYLKFNYVIKSNYHLVLEYVNSNRDRYHILLLIYVTFVINLGMYRFNTL